MTTSAEPVPLPEIDRVYVINLASRPDRRREMIAELDRIGLHADHPGLEFFAAVRPESAGSFPSIGARGCFLSHLGVLRDAQKRNLQAILILEDDAAFSTEGRAQLRKILAGLDRTDWAIAYLGYRISAGLAPGPAQDEAGQWRLLPAETGVETTHAMLIRDRAIVPLITYFERMMNRPSGHADGGPMHVDGAYSWFRRAHPDQPTLVTSTPCVLQRASKSDIARASWKDRVPFVNLLRQIKNQFPGRQ